MENFLNYSSLTGLSVDTYRNCGNVCGTIYEFCEEVDNGHNTVISKEWLIESINNEHHSKVNDAHINNGDYSIDTYYEVLEFIKEHSYEIFE